MAPQHRKRARFDYSAHALVRSINHGTIKGNVRDIGQESIYLYMEPFLDLGLKVDIEITLNGVDSQLLVKVPGQVIRTDLDGTAFRFFNPLEWWPLFTLFPQHQLESTAHETTSVNL